LQYSTSESTPATIQGKWDGFELDKAYDFTTPQGNQLKGSNSYIYLEPLQRTPKSAMYPVKVRDDLKAKLKELDASHNGKVVTLNVEVRRGSQGYTLFFVSVVKA